MGEIFPLTTAWLLTERKVVRLTSLMLEVLSAIEERVSRGTLLVLLS